MRSLDKWRKTVKERDSKVCRKCGFTRKLEAHHIMPRGKYPEFELELENGMYCHRKLGPPSKARL